MSLNIVFMGTPDFAALSLRKIAEAGHTLKAVYTRAPAPSGRGMKNTLSPVHRLAVELHLPVETPPHFKQADTLATLMQFQPDVIVVVAYGLLLPKAVLTCPPLGCLNVHASLLPRWRGAAPIQRAIMAGDHESGVGIMQMEEGLDTGPVALETRCPITPDMTAGQLHDELAQSGAALLVTALERLEQGRLTFTPQSGAPVLYAKKITNEDCQIDWSLPAQCVHDHIRGLSPFPGAFTQFDFGKGKERVKILNARMIKATGPAGHTLDDQLTIGCGSDAVQILRLQRAGSKTLSGADFLRGHDIQAGAQFF